jgi:hypothetical protein
MAYNGWKNYQTWNVALWIGNDESLYNSARGYKNYLKWVEDMGLRREKTPDGVLWDSAKLSYAELNSMMRELHG